MDKNSQEGERDFPMFEAGSGAVKRAIEFILHKILGTEVNAKLDAKKAAKAKKKK
jgi:hypothetical protein